MSRASQWNIFVHNKVHLCDWMSALTSVVNEVLIRD